MGETLAELRCASSQCVGETLAELRQAPGMLIAERLIANWAVAYLLLTSVFSPCSSSFQSPESGTYAIDHNGINRTYRLFVPTRYARDGRTALPLIAIFHGWSEDENAFLRYDVVRKEADERGYILLAPRGLGDGPPDLSFNSWTFPSSSRGVSASGQPICNTSLQANLNYASCVAAGVARNVCSWTQCVDDDMAFVLLLIKHVSSQLSVDASNIFAAGGSNGGMFTWALGQSASTSPTFRALASVVGLPFLGDVAPPGRSSPLPVILVTGSSDPTVPPGAWGSLSPTEAFDGDHYFFSSASTITKAWADANCQARVGGGAAVDFDEGQGAASDCRTYCVAQRGQWPAVLDCRLDMQHEYRFETSWPLILDFFDNHRAPSGQNATADTGEKKAATTEPPPGPLVAGR